MNALVFLISVTAFGITAQAQCHRNGAYDPYEIAGSTFFSTREQPSSRLACHYPWPQVQVRATVTYCTGQLTVWTEQSRTLAPPAASG
jgi:hypothetical protein